MKLKKFLLRYYPPGILLEYIRNNGEVETKSIDLLNLSAEYSPNNSRTDVDELVEEIASEEPIITESKKPQLKGLIESKHPLIQNSSSNLRRKRIKISSPSRPSRRTSCPSPTAASTRTAISILPSMQIHHG
jgi:hypothetical protein